MAKCKNCKNLSSSTNMRAGGRFPWCEEKIDSPDIELDRNCDKYIGMTNADRIRNMADEELANWLMETISQGGDNLFGCDHSLGCVDCKQCHLEWLQKEVE